VKKINVQFGLLSMALAWIVVYLFGSIVLLVSLVIDISRVGKI
jgi:hypothetical protein